MLIARKLLTRAAVWQSLCIQHANLLARLSGPFAGIRAGFPSICTIDPVNPVDIDRFGPGDVAF